MKFYLTIVQILLIQPINKCIHFAQKGYKNCMHISRATGSQVHKTIQKYCRLCLYYNLSRTGYLGISILLILKMD